MLTIPTYEPLRGKLISYVRDPKHCRAALIGINAAHQLRSFERVLLVGDRSIRPPTAAELHDIVGLTVWILHYD